MSQIPSRLQAAEKRISRISNPRDRDTLLMTHITRGTFTVSHLDQLFGIVYPTFRAATLVTAALFSDAGSLHGPLNNILGDLAMYVGQSSIRISGDRDLTFARCHEEFSRSEELRNPRLRPESDNRYRILRGLAQRLIRADGLESLGEAVEFVCDHPLEDWPLPVLDRTESQRIERLVAPIQPESDYHMVLWRNPDGTPAWEYPDLARRRST